MAVRTHYKLTSQINPLLSSSLFTSYSKQSLLVTVEGNAAHIFNPDIGQVVATLRHSRLDPTITALCVSERGQTSIFTSYSNEIIREWEVTDLKKVSVKSTLKTQHKGPAVLMEVCLENGSLCTTGADGSIQVFRFQGGTQRTCTNHFHIGHGLISCFKFIETTGQIKIVAAASDCKIRIFGLNKEKPMVFEGHTGTVTSFIQQGTSLMSSGRDGVVIEWDLGGLSNLTKKNVLPIGNPIEFFALSGSTGLAICSSGIVSCWDLNKNNEIRRITLADCVKNGEEVISSIVGSSHKFSICTIDRILVSYSINDGEKPNNDGGKTQKSLITKDSVWFGDLGYISHCFPLKKTHFIIAGNSPRLFILPEFGTKGLSSSVLAHETNVMALAAQGGRAVSGGKDGEIKIWKFVKTLEPLGKVIGHLGSVAAFCLTSDFKKSGSFFSAGSDLTLKMWDFQEEIRCRNSLKVHEKPVNSLRLSPNEKLLCSAAADKVAVVFNVKNNVKNGFEESVRMVGHRGGVWVGVFSPVDKVLGTGSADGTIRLWALDGSGCFNIINAHSSSVVMLSFISQGEVKIVVKTINIYMETSD